MNDLSLLAGTWAELTSKEKGSPMGAALCFSIAIESLLCRALFAKQQDLAALLGASYEVRPGLHHRGSRLQIGRVVVRSADFVGR